MAGYFDEAMQVREMLNSRYDDLKSRKVKPISGDEVEAYFRQKSAARRSQQQPTLAAKLPSTPALPTEVKWDQRGVAFRR